MLEKQYFLILSILLIIILYIGFNDQALNNINKLLTIRQIDYLEFYAQGLYLRFIEQLFQQTMEYFDKALTCCLFTCGQYQIAYSMLKNANKIRPNNKIIEQMLEQCSNFL
ncbi:unnamed protein product [Paramecium sonneborni]|uniref:Transmembrane protein n=1 Tax=Paramecium sonneborni TaxID=65129 RepID=A0A8S1N2R2_9CILI|nr:unnamed protein product [Paramecium sonneborni]